jgi:DNA repair protein RecO (recombination protein O)
MAGRPAAAGGRALICGYYLNELLVRLTAARGRPPAAVRAYAEAVRALGRGEPEEPILRRFELACCRSSATRPGSSMRATAASRSRPEGATLYIIERGPVETLEEEGVALIPRRSASSRCCPARRCSTWPPTIFRDPETLAQSKQLMRMLINHTLGGQPLQSRRVLKELQEL